MATEDENKAILREYIEQVSNTGDTTTISRYIADDFQNITARRGCPPALPGLPR